LDWVSISISISINLAIEVIQVIKVME
jgi:hypothetical protein